jgi:hypothetical protein
VHYKLERSSITRGLDTIFYVILTLYLLYNFNKILVILYIYGMTLLCINILAFIFDSLYSMLYMPSTLIAPRNWLQFAAKT